MLPTAAASWPELLDRLAAKGVLDPTDDDILRAAEELADRLDVEGALESAPEPARAAVVAALTIAKRLGRPEWWERLSLEEAVRLAKKHAPEVAGLMVKYPRLTVRILGWLKWRLTR